MTLTPQILTYRLQTKATDQEEVSALHDLVWSLTFCDLVTCLLCFFLTMVSFGPIGRGASSQNKISEPVSEPIKHVTEAGTGLALKGNGTRKRLFTLSPEDFTALAAGGEVGVLGEVKSIAGSAGYETRRIRITVSPSAAGTQEGSKWLSIIQRLSDLQRQLFDARWQTSLVLRIARVPEETGNEAEKQIVGTIEIEDERSPNG